MSKGVDELLGGGDDGEFDEEEGSVAPSVRSLSPGGPRRAPPTPDLNNTDGTLMLFPGSSSSRTGFVFPSPNVNLKFEF